MNEKEIEKKLRLYIEKTKEEAETEGYISSAWMQWIFGAIDFAVSADIISREVYEELRADYWKMIKEKNEKSAYAGSNPDALKQLHN